MLKLMNKKQKTTTNKGFSLVELIVVIAIMAVLVAVLAPAMVRYVENSRKSNDAQVVAGVVNTLEAAIIDEAVPAGTYTVTITGSGCSNPTNDPTGTPLLNALTNAYNNTNNIQLKSNTWRNGGVTVTITVTAGGATTVTYASTQDANEETFAQYTGLPQTGGNNNQQQGGNNNQQQGGN